VKVMSVSEIEVEKIVCTVCDVLIDVRLVVIGTILVTKLETGLAVTVAICADVNVLVEAG